METNFSECSLRDGLELSHSLGELIEWKLAIVNQKSFESSLSHSLGELIEWKRL